MTTCTSSTQNGCITRDDVLKLLSNDEVANVASAEAGIRLADGAQGNTLYELYSDDSSVDVAVNKARRGVLQTRSPS